MNKTIFSAGLGIIIIEIIGFLGYVLLQQDPKFVENLVLFIIIGGINLAAVIMIFVGLFNDKQ